MMLLFEKLISLLEEKPGNKNIPLLLKVIHTLTLLVFIVLPLLKKG